MIEGMTYLIITGASTMIGVAPGNNVQYLNALAAHAKAAEFNYVVVAVADLALVPAAIGAYLALKNVSRTLMTVATGLILSYVVIDMATFVPAALSLVVLSRSAQTAIVLTSEHAALSIVPFSQFFGWVEPQIAFAIYIFTLWRANIGRFARIFGILCVLFCVVGGISFLIPAWTSLQNFQLPALAVYGLFFLGFGEAILRLRGKEGLIQSAIPQ